MNAFSTTGSFTLLLVLVVAMTLSGCDDGIYQPQFAGMPLDTSNMEQTAPNDGNLNYGELYFSSERTEDAGKVSVEGSVLFSNGLINCFNNDSSEVTRSIIIGPLDFGISDSVTVIWWLVQQYHTTYQFQATEDAGDGEPPSRWQTLTTRKNSKGWESGALRFSISGRIPLYFRFFVTIPPKGVLKIKPVKAYGK